jgi:hypothetical protein
MYRFIFLIKYKASLLNRIRAAFRISREITLVYIRPYEIIPFQIRQTPKIFVKSIQPYCRYDKPNYPNKMRENFMTFG